MSPDELDSTILNKLLERLATLTPIKDPYNEIVLLLAECSETMARLLVSLAGTFEGYALGEHIQMVSATFEESFVGATIGAKDQSLLLLMRLWVIFHDMGKPECYLATESVKDQSVYNVRFVQHVLVPALQRTTLPVSGDILSALIAMCTDSLLGKVVKYYTRPKTRGTPSSMTLPMALAEVPKIIDAFPIRFRHSLGHIILASYLPDVRSYTTHVSYITSGGIEVPRAPGALDYVFAGPSLQLHIPEAQEALDALIQEVNRLTQ